MRTPRSVFVRLGALIAILVSTGCEDSPVSPDELDAAQVSEIQAMLGEVLAKLDDIDQRIDSLEATIDAAGSMPVTLTGLPAEQLDSLMAVASWIAQDIVEESMGGWEFCGEFAGGFEVGLKFASQAEGKASADLGAWAGTGAFAGGTVKGAGTLEGGVAGEGKAAIAYCNPFGDKVLPGDARPVTASLNGPSRAGELAALETALSSVATQLNLTPASLGQALTGVGGAFSGSAALDLQGVGDYLPLPPALAAIADDPIGAAVSRVQGLASTATSALCSGGNWGSNVSTVINEVCGVIAAGGLANISAFADIASTYPAVRTAVGNACTRVNSIGLQRLIIPSWDLTIINTTYQVFPGYNQRLFPNYASFACP